MMCYTRKRIQLNQKAEHLQNLSILALFVKQQNIRMLLIHSEYDTLFHNLRQKSNTKNEEKRKIS